MYLLILFVLPISLYPHSTAWSTKVLIGSKEYKTHEPLLRKLMFYLGSKSQILERFKTEIKHEQKKWYRALQSCPKIVGESGIQRKQESF